MSNNCEGNYKPNAKYLNVGFNGTIRHSNIYKPTLVFTLYFVIIIRVFGPYLSWRLGKFFLIGQANAILPK